ncbi:hypothetical protein ONZ45_g8509 [Pleurotus djamor]|nr:hypothetical protein ONZ45_g8509 [Pleurotus djamor]
MDSVGIFALALAGGLVAVIFYHQRRNSAFTRLRGPPSPSWLLGNDSEMHNQAQVGDLDFAWVREFGPTFSVKTCWGRTNVMTADPRALQYIYNTSGYRYPNRADIDQITRNMTGPGILWASGKTHQRHRRVMNPAFTAQQLRGFLPLFQQTASRLTLKWKDQLQGNTPTVLNVSQWLARATLDAVGKAAFDFDFDAIDDGNGELTKCFRNLFADSNLYPPLWDVLFKSLWRYIPLPILHLVEYIPSKEYRRFRYFKKVANRIAKQLIDEKAHATQPVDRAKDVMSVLANANTSEDPKRRLSEEEVLSQMATIMLAGSESTASTLAWLLYELSRHPEDQKKVRAEIRELRQSLPTGTEFNVANFESMTFTTAVIKEVLRMHPIVPLLVRTAAFDDVLPLSVPITTKDGNVVTEVSIKKDTDIYVSVCAYNRLSEVWGPDADLWNPRRFLVQPKDKQVNVGVFASLMSFGSGTRGCIGWRFALLELQALLIELIENFEFRMPKDVEILRMPAGVMVPMVKGRMHEGTQMPLNCLNALFDPGFSHPADEKGPCLVPPVVRKLLLLELLYG